MALFFVYVCWVITFVTMSVWSCIIYSGFNDGSIVNLCVKISVLILQNLLSFRNFLMILGWIDVVNLERSVV